MQKIENFPKNQYFQDLHKKRRICLHHTCGSTAEGAIEWWKQKPEKVGTAYIIDKDGTVHQVFNDNFWAYQLGLKTPNRTEIEQSTIGIEIVNEGALYERNGKFYTDWNKQYSQPVTKQNWRGYRCWANYTEQQYAACAALINTIAQKHEIKLTLNENLDFNPKILDTHTIINHANVRQDKTDLSPAFDFQKLKQYLSLI